MPDYYRRGGRRSYRKGKYGSYMVASNFTRRTQRRKSRALSRRNWRWGGALGVERKWLDSSINAVTINAAGNMTGCEMDPGALCLNFPLMGTGQNNRIGNKYNITSIQVTGLCYLNPEANQTGAEPAYKINVALVWDKQTNGAQLNSEDVWANPAATVAGAANPLRNLLYSKRFKILKKTLVTLKPTTLSYDGTNMEQGGDVAPFEFYKEFKKPVVVECRGNSGDVTDIVNHSFHVLASANVGGITTMFYNARIRFTDP